MPEAWLSEDRSTVYMLRGGWSGSFPASEIERWLEFYRGLRDRRHGKFSHIYAPAVAALERVYLQVRTG